MDKKHQDVLTRALTTFGTSKLTDVIPKTRAIIGVTTLPSGEKDAQMALDKLGQGVVPEPKELAALEIMMRLMRPAPLCRNGVLDALPDYCKYEPGLVEAWERFRALVWQSLMSIGRIDRLGDGEQGVGMGTGFLVGKDLLLTNRHVLDAITFGAQDIAEGQAVVKFQQQTEPTDTEPSIPIISKVFVHETLDIALMRIRHTIDRKAIKLSMVAPIVGDRVVAVGYPSDDPARNPLFIQQIYNGDFGVKRAAPGQIIARSNDLLFHDCSTLGGNSGSPLFSMATGNMVGIHSSGMFMYRNEAIIAAVIQSKIASFALV